MKSDEVNCFNALDAVKISEGSILANDDMVHDSCLEDNDSSICAVDLNSFSLAQKDQIKLRIFSTIYGLTPEEVLVTALRDYMDNNGTGTLKTVFSSLDAAFSTPADDN